MGLSSRRRERMAGHAAQLYRRARIRAGRGCSRARAAFLRIRQHAHICRFDRRGIGPQRLRERLETRAFADEAQAGFPGDDDAQAVSYFADKLRSAAYDGGLVLGAGGRVLRYRDLAWLGRDAGCSQEHVEEAMLEWGAANSPTRDGERNFVDDASDTLESCVAKLLTFEGSRRGATGCRWEWVAASIERRTPVHILSGWALSDADADDGADPATVIDLAEARAERAKNPAAKAGKPAFAFNFDIHARPGQGARYLLQDLLPHIPGETGSIVAASSSGKTTVACGIAAALATCSDYLGAKNRSGRKIGVLFVSGESFNDTSRSFSALQKRSALPVGSPVLHLAMPEPKHLQAMIDAADHFLFQETGVHLGVVIFDTLSQCFAYLFRDKGQSSTEPNNELTAFLVGLATSKGRSLAIWTLDHLGKDETRGAIGSVAKDFKSAAILTLKKPRGQAVGSITVLKVKGAPDHLPSFWFKIEGEHLFDENLNPDALGVPEMESITGAIARAVAPVAPPSEKPLAANQGKMLAVLGSAGAKGLTQAEWLAGGAAVEVKRATGQDAIAILKAHGRVTEQAGRYSMAVVASAGFAAADEDD